MSFDLPLTLMIVSEVSLWQLLEKVHDLHLQLHFQYH